MRHAPVEPFSSPSPKPKHFTIPPLSVTDPVAPLARPTRISTKLDVVSRTPLSITKEPDVMSNVFCALNVELTMFKTPPRSMLTVREEENGVPEGTFRICTVLVKPEGADTTRLRTARLVARVAVSILTVLVPALEM